MFTSGFRPLLKNVACFNVSIGRTDAPDICRWYKGHCSHHNRHIVFHRPRDQMITLHIDGFPPQQYMIVCILDQLKSQNKERKFWSVRHYREKKKYEVLRLDRSQRSSSSIDVTSTVRSDQSHHALCKGQLYSSKLQIHVGIAGFAWCHRRHVGAQDKGENSLLRGIWL